MRVNTQRLTAVLLSLTLVGAPALAQPGGPGGPHRPNPRAQGHRPPPPPPGHFRPPPRPMAVPEYRHFNRGDRLPPQYRQRQYVVNDWRGHGLRPPPPGYHWVQNGSDYVLAAIATGVISAVILNALVNR